MVTKLIEPAVPEAKIEMIEIETTYSQRSFRLPWRELMDETKWLQGWKRPDSAHERCANVGIE